MKRMRTATGDDIRAVRERLFDAASAHTPLLGVDTRSGRFLVSTADRMVGRKLFVRRARGEMRTLRSALELLQGVGIDPRADRRAFMDVGANIGTSLIPALTRHGFARGIAFEPEPGNFRLLISNLALNDVEDRVQAFEVALSDREGIAELALDPDNSGNHRLGAAGAGERMEVRVATFDGLVAAGEVDPGAVGMLWVDAQGHEPHVLAGASALLARGVPAVLEVWPPVLRRDGGMETLCELIAAHWSHIALADGGGLVPVSDLDALFERHGDAVVDLLAVRR